MRKRTKLAGALVSSGLANAIGERSHDPLDLARELGLDSDVTVMVLDTAVTGPRSAT